MESWCETVRPAVEVVLGFRNDYKGGEQHLRERRGYSLFSLSALSSPLCDDIAKGWSA